MNTHFVKHIRFPLISKDYLCEKIEPSGILSFETLYQALKCLDKADNKYKYASNYKWYPRKPYYQRFLSCYDIKLLTPGDKIYVAKTSGLYLPEKIKSIDWGHNSRNKLSCGIMFDNKEDCYAYTNFSVATLRNHWYLAMDVERWAMEGDAKNGEPMLGNVQYRKFQSCCWVNGTALRSVGPDRWTGMVIYIRVQTTKPNSAGQSTFYVHPWNFECIRST